MRNCEIEKKISSIANRLYLKGYDLSKIGVKDGLMGQIVFFFIAGRNLKNKVMESYAEAMLKDLCSSIHNKGTNDFVGELCDVGCALDYLVKEGYAKGEINDILVEFDYFIYQIPLKRMCESTSSTVKRAICEYFRMRIKAKQGISILHETSFISEIQWLMGTEGLDYYIFMSQSENFLDCLIQYIKGSKKKKSLWQKGLILLQDYTPRYEIPTPYPIRMKKTGREGRSLFVFSQECRGANYGVGTYIEQLKSCFPIEGWKVYLINLCCSSTRIKETKIDKDFWLIEIPNCRKIKDSQYICGVFHFLSSHLKNTESIICHFNFVIDIAIVRKFKKEFGAKIIFTLHYTNWSFALGGDKNILVEEVLKRKSKKYKYVYKEFENERLFMKECDIIIAISKHSRKTIETIYNIETSKVQTIYNSIHINDTYNMEITQKMRLRAKYGFEKDSKIFIFIGRLDTIKGVNSLIDSFISAKKESPVPSKLIIAGDGNFQELMNAAYGYWNDIVFTGFVDKQTVRELVRLSDYGVIPSIFEEFGYVTLEMLSNGLPIIANDTSGIAEIINNVGGGHLYNNNTENNLSNAILNALNGCIYIPDFKIERFKKYYSFETFSSCIHELLCSF